MPAITVFSGGPTRGSDAGPHLAAAVMAVTLAKSSEPLEAVASGNRMKAERTRPRNPNRLTINQHVLPAKSIERFTNRSGRVLLHDLRRGREILVKPDNSFFCACRAWDERAETGYMKCIEDEFQKIVDSILNGRIAVLAPEDKAAVDRMYALWHMRSRCRELEWQEQQLKGVGGSDLTKEQEENLEKNGYVFVRRGGRMPARQLNGVVLQMRIFNYARDLAARVSRWGIISAQSGEFIVPDIPVHGIIPLTPRLALVQSAPDGMIVERNVAEINSALRATSRDYFFARDLSSCHFHVSVFASTSTCDPR